VATWLTSSRSTLAFLTILTERGPLIRRRMAAIPFNTAEGQNALLSLTTGISNTAIGFDALINTTIGNKQHGHWFFSRRQQHNR
jgi:hypothetical protein